MMKKIEALSEGDHINSSYLVSNVTKGVTTNSRSYLTVTFQDNSGTIEGKKWDVQEGDNEIFKVGNVVNIDGEVISYRERLQLKIYDGEIVNPELIDYERFVPAPPIPREELEKKLDLYLASFSSEPLKKLVNAIIARHRKSYVSYPAAMSFHHNFASGLLYHSLSMADLGEQVAKLYPSVNRDLLIAGCLLHDIGKVVELSGLVATKYTLEGKLLGHLAIGAMEVKEVADSLKIEGEMPLLLEHLLLSHHGKPEFGAAIMPLTREALALAMIDDLDAKMNVLDKAFKGLEPGSFSSRIMALDDRSFYLMNDEE